MSSQLTDPLDVGPANDGDKDNSPEADHAIPPTGRDPGKNPDTGGAPTTGVQHGADY